MLSEYYVKMKKKLFLGSLLYAFLCMGILSNCVYAAEFSAPTIDSCSVSSHAISDATGGVVTVTLHVTSKNGLISPVFVLFNLLGDESHHLAGSGLSLVSGDSKSGTWSQKITVKPNLTPGKYNLTIYPLIDSQQNSTLNLISCPGEEIVYGMVASLDPTQTPAPKRSTTPTPTSSISSDSQALQKQVVALINQINDLQFKVNTLSQYEKFYISLKNQIKRICGVKKKPAGCTT
jgi:hypothetical protein